MSKNIRIPVDFQIYSSMEGASEANAALGACCERFIASLRTHSGPLSVAALNTMIETHFKPEMNRLADFGTWDTEPRSVIASFVRRAMVGLGWCDDEWEFDRKFGFDLCF